MIRTGVKVPAGGRTQDSCRDEAAGTGRVRVLQATRALAAASVARGVRSLERGKAQLPKFRSRASPPRRGKLLQTRNKELPALLRAWRAKKLTLDYLT